MSRIDEMHRLLDACTPEQRKVIFDRLRKEFPIHDLELKWNVAAEIIMEAIDRASDLTKRGIRGVIAEAAFGAEIIAKLPSNWRSEPVSGDPPYDFLIIDSIGQIRIQVKLQRQSNQQPMVSENVPRKYRFTPGSFVVETQRTRKGTDPATGEDTRPYRFGEFDLLAVSLHPSTGDWSQFMITVADWLLPRADNPSLIQIYQPVSPTRNTDWTDNLLECVTWFRQGIKKRIDQPSNFP